MKVLLTGAKGFVGAWVLRELDAHGMLGVPFNGDLRYKDSFPDEKFSLIIHLASLITHRGKISSDELYSTNVKGTKNLLEAYSKTKVSFVSTTDVTRDNISQYAATKLEAEEMVRTRGRYNIIRLPSVFGPKPRQVKLIPLLFDKYCKNVPCNISNNDEREYIFVRDAAKQIVSHVKDEGVITVEGFKIRNYDLDKMIAAVCRGKNMLNMSDEERYFYSCLKMCVPGKPPH